MSSKFSRQDSMFSSTPKLNFDVFLSFRGEDTRFNFTSHLYSALRQKGITTFIDDQLQRGDEISNTLLQVIEESRISIVVFSQNYAFSTWCLNELVKIIECRKSKKQMVWPVFYKIDPSDVRKQSGSFGEALAEHEDRFFNDMMKIQKWREALTAAANLSGWHLGTGKEALLVQRIIEAVLSKLNRTPLHVARYPVGIDSQVRVIESLLDMKSRGVIMIGIYGVGGIGKTTLVKAVYNHIADQFEGCSFLANAREASNQFGGLVQLQETLLFEILGDILKVGNLDRGINIIRNRLSTKQILIVLDDVDKCEQLETLVGRHDWFGLGSRIIVTTRNKHLLVSHGFDKLHNLQELDHEKALELLSWNAFKKNHPCGDYTLLSKRAISYARGLPLAIVVMGSFLSTRGKSEWKSALDKLDKTPNKQVQESLKISYDGLENNEKAIFLDIACFFVGEDKDHVISMLEACNFYPDIGIRVLIDLSLITIESNKLQMHDLIQQMGREIVRQESLDPGGRSRLWLEEEVMDVLTNNTATNAIEGIKLKLSGVTELKICTDAFRNMSRLRLLIVRNAHFSGGLEFLPNNLRWIELPGYASSSLPPNFHPKKLVRLDMQHSHIKQLGKGFMNLESLKYLNLSSSKFLVEIPDCSTLPNLEHLNLSECKSLLKIHQSVGCLDKLLTLDLKFCSNLQELPSHLKLRSLQSLNLGCCFKLEQFPEIIGGMGRLSNINLEFTAIKELPWSIKYLTGLKVLNLVRCTNLIELPSSLRLLSSLNLLLGGCYRHVRYLPNVQTYNNLVASFSTSSMVRTGSSNSGFVDFELPKTTSYANLSWLDLRYCNISNVNSLNPYFNISSSLSFLDLSGNNFASLPSCFIKFTSLKNLQLRNCKFLKEIPKLPSQIQIMNASGCSSLINIQNTVADILFSYKEIDQLFVHQHPVDLILAGSEIPEWFSYQSSMHYVSFQLPSVLCRKLRALALCVSFTLKYHDKSTFISCKVSVNGGEVVSFSRKFLSLTSDHVWLRLIPCRFTVDSLSKMKDFTVSFGIKGVNPSRIRSCGVHLVEKLQTGNVSLLPRPSSSPNLRRHLQKSERGRNFDIDVWIPEILDDECDLWKFPWPDYMDNFSETPSLIMDEDPLWSTKEHGSSSSPNKSISDQDASSSATIENTDLEFNGPPRKRLRSTY